MSQKLAGGTVHEMPNDFNQAILASPKALKIWNDITPLARNEWICWVISGAKAETRVRRIKVGISKMNSGERRPCCWIGCIHRPDKAVSPSVQWALSRQKTKKSL